MVTNEAEEKKNIWWKGNQQLKQENYGYIDIHDKACLALKAMLIYT